MSLNDKMTAIADAIREKTGGTDPLSLDAIAAAVPAVYAAGKSAAEALCDATHFVGTVRGSGTGTLSVPIPFEPDTLLIVAANMRIFTYQIAVCVYTPHALGKYLGGVQTTQSSLSLGMAAIRRDQRLVSYADGVRNMTEDEKERIRVQNERFSEEGLRVLAFAYRESDEPLTTESERELIFLGLISMVDPPRPESVEAVADAKRAGIRPVMITGDHKITAVAIAKEIGIYEEGDLALTGAELDALSEEELDERITRISVYARVSPENKIRIVEAWQKKGNIVSMTGDGVNDAPALKKADIGVAMGITGTEVSKDAAAMILSDDNFATIIKAVANGRNVYRNIKNAVLFLLSGNTAGILAVLYTSVMALPVPFAPVHLLFINLLTDSLPALAIGMEPADDSLLKEKPRDPKTGILTGDFLRKMLVEGALIAAASIWAYGTGYAVSPAKASTMAFATLTLARLFHGFNCRGNESIFRLGLRSNKYSIYAFAAGIFFLGLVLALPALHGVFEIVPLAAADLGRIAGLAVGPTVVIQLFRVLRGCFSGKRADRG